MSFQHLRLVIEHSRTRGPGRAIMLALAYRADDEGCCWPSLPRIAKDSELTRRTVTRCLPRIEGTGELLIEHRGRTVSTYGGKQAANLYRLTIAPPEGTDGQSPPSPAKVGTASPKGRDSQSPKVGTDSPEGRDRLTPEPSEKGKSEPSMNRKRGAAGLSGHRIDYQTAEPPNIEGDGYNVIHGCPDPILAAMAVTGRRSKADWGYWVKVLHRARKTHGRERADRLFRGCLDELHGEMKPPNPEWDNSARGLNVKLHKVFPECA